MKKFDFGGYATKNDLECGDGRVIKAGAFSNSNGKQVPLVWQHGHNDPKNVLGHAILEEREDGVYAYCTFNKTESGKIAHELVKEGNINMLSIFANKLKQKANNVVHGVIREVSLVLSGSNPGALIDNVTIAHSDGGYEVIDNEAVIYSGIVGESDPVKHEDAKEDDEKDESDKKNKSVKEVYDALTDEQKEAVNFLVGAAVEEAVKSKDDTDDVEHDDLDEGDDMSRNIFLNKEKDDAKDTLSHSEIKQIFDDAITMGSLRESVLKHGITSIETLFPEVKNVTPTPHMISRPMEWVDEVFNGTHKTPFSRVKSTAANVTADEARAKGYIKGKKKVEEQLSVLKRSTTPQTVYKKQQLDRDDIIDITDFDVVMWLKGEMRMMLKEEISRAILIGDGRSVSNDDKIKEEHVRPIWTDNDVYSVKTVVPTDEDVDDAQAFMDAVVRARKNYKGSGQPALYVGTDLLTDMRLLKDGLGHRLYKSDEELAAYMRVSKIVEIELFDDKIREVDTDQYKLGGIIVNLKDYTIGADRGGETTMFDDFDIDYNQYKYLIETRCSGALTRPASALVVEFAV